MSTLQLSIVCGSVLALAAMILSVWAPRASRPRAREGIFDTLAYGQEIAVHLDRQSITGRVVEVTADAVVLADAMLVTGSERTKLKGLARIPDSGVALVQETTPVVTLADAREARG